MPKKLTKTLVTFTALAAISGGSLITASTALAAPADKPAATSDAVAPLAVNNLGLTANQAMKLQANLAKNGYYTGAIDGQLGPQSWKAIQAVLKERWGYNDAIDGIVGPNTIQALQRYLKAHFNYTGAIDGIAGPETRAAFARSVDVLAPV
ncbi:peptidoglycan-binding domain-containing protein [Streptomyces xiamenensis]